MNALAFGGNLGGGADSGPAHCPDGSALASTRYRADDGA